MPRFVADLSGFTINRKDVKVRKLSDYTDEELAGAEAEAIAALTPEERARLGVKDTIGETEGSA